MFQLVVESAPAAMVMVDKEGKIHLVNRQAESLFGYSREELLGQRIEILVPERFRGIHSVLREGFSRDPQTRAMGRGRDLFGLTKDGKEIPIEIGLNSIETAEGMCTLASMIDITERRRSEDERAVLQKRLESVNRELNDFAYVVSHDLKAPLRNIASLADWIAADYSDKLGKEGKDQLGLMNGRVKRMSALIDGILRYSKLGRLEEEKERVDLNQLVRETIDLLGPPRNVEVTVTGKLPVLFFEKVRIQQVFQNLIGNAIKFLDKPKGKVRMGCADTGADWKFSVEDNGPGIEERYQQRIFKMFETLASSDDGGSTGIGLTIAKKIVEMNGGKIWLESKVGQGSTFFFSLPKDSSSRSKKKETADENEKTLIAG